MVLFLLYKGHTSVTYVLVPYLEICDDHCRIEWPSSEGLVFVGQLLEHLFVAGCPSGPHQSEAHRYDTAPIATLDDVDLR